MDIEKQREIFEKNLDTRFLSKNGVSVFELLEFDGSKYKPKKKHSLNNNDAQIITDCLDTWIACAELKQAEIDDLELQLKAALEQN